MEYKFEFISTHRDLIDSYIAVKNSNSGLSGWSRTAVLILGIMWLLGFILLTPTADNLFQPLIWLLLGVSIIWYIGVKPYLEKKHIKEVNDEEQNVKLLVNDHGITAIDESDQQRCIEWKNVEVIENAKKGIFIGFDDGLINWLPNRLFANKKQKKRFINSVINKINEHNNEEP